MESFVSVRHGEDLSRASLQKARWGKLAGPVRYYRLRRADFDVFGILHFDLYEDLGATVQDRQFGTPARRTAFGQDHSGTGGARYSKSVGSDFGGGELFAKSDI